ncbi:proteasome protein [Actinomyces sp. 2119]|uniref:proteasome accessory factor PafA2 family protein n=1 Tax=Actinomyces sp. 2119 TaxID=2321393 RepID=UPI000E6CA506|nr:proteasome accessory factor PafA2 family protein [Actinomyces sp. 2119]RJF43133.1 proteasome protein [Actinomyces sp. 2119]
MASRPGRVTGLETELAVVCAPLRGAVGARADAPTGRTGPAESADSTGSTGPADLMGAQEAAAFLLRHRPEGYRSDNLFLPNGGRLYLDVGSHPEYATAECATVRDLVAQDQAGRALLAAMARRATTTLSRRGTPARIHVLANNTDSAGHTYGCHENYSVPRSLDIEAVMPVLASFLATRPVLVGTGVPLPGGAPGQEGHELPGRDTRGDQVDLSEDACWGLSPRAPHLRALASADTTGQRALVNTRDQPHADRERLRRLHVTCADTTMAEPTAGLRSVLTLLLLDALEAGEDFSDLVLADPLAVLGRLGTSAWGEAEARTCRGRELSAVDVQEAFAERLARRLETEGTPPALEGADHLLRDLAPRVVTALRTRDASGIDTEIDWAVKRRVMRAHRARHPDLGGRALEVLRTRVDLAYHDLDADTGLTARLRQQGGLASLCDPEETARARTQPPPTRAALRGEFVRACLARGADFSVTWESLRLDSPPTTPVDLPDPLASQDDAAQALTERVRSLSRREMRLIDLPGRSGLGVPG